MEHTVFGRGGGIERFAASAHQLETRRVVAHKLPELVVRGREAGRFHFFTVVLRFHDGPSTHKFNQKPHRFVSVGKLRQVLRPCGREQSEAERQSKK